MRLPMFLAVMVLASGTFASSSTHACRCIDPTLERAFGGAATVFAGRVLGVTKTPRDPIACARHPDWCVFSYTYQVEVEGVWKGAVPDTVEILAGHGRGDCSYGPLSPSADDEHWLFMSTGTGRELPIRLCSGNQKASPTLIERLTKAHGAPRAPVSKTQ